MYLYIIYLEQLSRILGLFILEDFLEKTTSWACLAQSELKNIFHRNVHSEIVLRYSFKLIA